MTPIKTLTLRLPQPLYDAARTAAERESLNAFIVRSVAEALRKREEQELHDAFTLAAEDPEGSDVEYAAHAQAEVVLRGA